MIDVEICSVASLLVGGNDFGSFEESVREAKLCGALYENTKLKLLQQNLWRFSLKQTQLPRLSNAPLYGYSYGYQIPPDALRISGSENSTEYKILGDKIFSNQPTLNITYQYNVDESKFPAYFTRVLELEMASLLALSLVDDKAKHQILENKARLELLKAKAIDSQNQTTVSISDNNYWITVVR